MSTSPSGISFRWCHGIWPGDWGNNFREWTLGTVPPQGSGKWDLVLCSYPLNQFQPVNQRRLVGDFCHFKSYFKVYEHRKLSSGELHPCPHKWVRLSSHTCTHAHTLPSSLSLSLSPLPPTAPTSGTISILNSRAEVPWSCLSLAAQEL